MIGSLIGGCRVDEAIGQGGFGVVYKATQASLDRTVAIKLLQPAISTDPEAVKAFASAARAAGKLQHPNIVRTYCYGFEANSHYTIMEYVSGRTLDKVLADEALSVSKALTFIEEIAKALDYAHGQEIIHGDLNPRNIIIADDSRVVLGDFVGSGSPSSGGSNKGVLGVAEYVSPEQARGMSATAKSDIYSLGIILYEMLTGRPPFTEAECGDTLFRQISSEPTPPSKLNRNISPRLEKLVLRMLFKNADARPPGCKWIIDEIEAIRLEFGPRKRHRARQERRRAHPLLVGGLLIVIAGLGGVGYLVGTSFQTDREFAALASDSSGLPALAAAKALDRSTVARYDDEIRRGQNFLNNEQYRDAASAFHRACKLQPRKADPHVFLAAVFIVRQDFRLAKYELDGALKLDPHNKDAEATLNYIKTKMSKEEDKKSQE